MAQITGEHVDWLHTHGDLYVAVELNNTDPDAIAANSGKAPPRLYRNISGQSFQNAVIVDNGSVVQFKVRSRGPFGFGYRVYAGLNDIRGRTRDVIANRLYCLSSNEQSQNTDIDRAFQDVDAKTQPLIQIRNFPSIDAIAPTDRDLQLGMMSCTVVSWGVYGYIDEKRRRFRNPTEHRRGPLFQPAGIATAEQVEPTGERDGKPSSYCFRRRPHTLPRQQRKSEPGTLVRQADP